MKCICFAGKRAALRRGPMWRSTWRTWQRIAMHPSATYMPTLHCAAVLLYIPLLL